MSAKHTKKPSRAVEASLPRRGRADIARLRALGEAEIARTTPPELADLPPDFWNEAEIVVPVPKQAISLRVDEDVLAWFRGLGPRYQTRMNAVLRAYMEHAATPPPRSAKRRTKGRVSSRTGRGAA